MCSVPSSRLVVRHVFLWLGIRPGSERLSPSRIPLCVARARCICWSRVTRCTSMPGDIPLATPAEIDAFVDGCDLARYDYCLGLSTEDVLQAYYPQDGCPGIQMAYFTLRDLRARQNNLHLVKPLRLGNRHYIQKMYNFRYQREWRNIMRMIWELCTTQHESLRVAYYYLCLHIARLSPCWVGSITTCFVP